MNRCDQMRQFLLSHREEILADTLFLARHQSPSSNKALTEQCAQIEMVPQNYQKLETEEHITLMEKLLDIMEDDDVQNVWHNWEQD